MTTANGCIKKINEDKFNNRVEKYCKSRLVKIKLGDLAQLMKAANRAVKFNIKNDMLLNGDLSEETKEMADAFSAIKKEFDEVYSKSKIESTNKVSNKYKTNDR